MSLIQLNQMTYVYTEKTAMLQYENVHCHIIYLSTKAKTLFSPPPPADFFYAQNLTSD
jgi:hypothetical protein